MEPRFLIVDLFCGAGGTTTGFAMSGGIAKVIACVNHDKKAIKSHWRNHKGVKHFNEDIRTLDLRALVKHVAKFRARYPDAKLILWASLECTNFSKAKGGLPRDADSRTLADHLHRYVAFLNPDIIQIENVVEFMSWGELDANGKPISKKNGSDWLRWRKEICAHGYIDEWKELNSADFGAYTSRNRLFGMFAKDPSHITWPEPTHVKNPSTGKMFIGQEKWKPVKDVLDFTDEGTSIFDRKKPLSDKTLERIYAGLLKYVAKGDKAFISKYFSGRPAGKVKSIEDPASTVTTFGGQTLINTKRFADLSVDQPAGTITTVDHHALVQPTFLMHYYGQGGQHSSINEPGRTIPTKARTAIVNTHFLEKSFGGYRNNQSVDQPTGTIMPNDKHRLIECEPFILNKNSSTAPSINTENPAPTITQRTHYLVNPSWGGNPGDVDQPSPVIIARQDKAPLYLIQCEHGPVQIAVYDQDTEIATRIKEFMAIYGLVDIKMRMLRVPELLKIQGFPADYILEGNQTDQKKFIGNSVVPLVVKCWIKAIDNSLRMAA